MIIVAIIAVIYFSAKIFLDSNKEDDKELSESNNKANDSENSGCLKGCLILIIIMVIAMFLLGACMDGLSNSPSRNFKQGDWNFDGDVDYEDVNTFIEWKSRQDD